MSPADDLPADLARLLDAADPTARDEAWKRFLDSYSKLILHTLYRLGGGYDTVMDRYAFVLEHLSRDEFRRLKSYSPSSRCKFSTWLVVVVHRLGLDHYRRQYGSVGASVGISGGGEEPRAARRRLVDLVSERLDLENLADTGDEAPDAAVQNRELRSALETALAVLAPRDRLLLKLRFELDLSARRIADLMAFPTPFHVYRRCNRLCERLRADLASQGIEDPLP